MSREARLAKVLPLVRDCLDRCFREDNPREAIREYIDRLKCDPQWTEADLKEFEATTDRAIALRCQRGNSAW